MNKLIKYITLMSVAPVALTMGARDITSLNFGWDFVAPDGSTKVVNLPHDYQIEQPWVAPNDKEKADNTDGAANRVSRLSARGFKEMGKGKYTKTLNVPQALKGQRLLLDFGGIMLVGDVYLNGERIGGTDYGYLGFECDITDKVKYGQDNEIEVIADTGEPLHSRWYTGGGLYRGVDMVVTDPDLYFNRHPLHIITNEIGTDKASVSIIADINSRKENEYFIADTEIIGPDGNVVISRTDTIPMQRKWRNREYQIAEIDIPTPQLWDTENPNLYRANVTLRKSNGQVADNYSDRFGIRTVEVSPEFGLKLNGKKVLLKGLANHHTLGALGAAAYPRAIENTLRLIKEFGFNHVRTSHNPYSEEFMDLCDEYGILVVDEIYDKWLKQYTGGRKEWTEQWQNDLPEWLKRDRNHPSVVVWSLGNELQGYNNLPFNDWGVTAYRLQKALLDKYDTTRPVTVAMHPRVRSLETDSLPAPLVHETDIASYNYRYMYFPGDGRRFPNLIFYQSEANLSNMGPNFFVPDNDKVLGLAYWGMIDYLGESLGWPAKGWSDGVFDIALNPKPNAWFLKSMFTDEPTVHIGVVTKDAKLKDWNGIAIGGDVVTDSWNLTPGDTVKLYTYTNADEVELKLNGKTIGRKTNDMDPNKRNRISWNNIPYKAGRLEAIAYKDGKVVDRHEIRTSGKAVRLVAEPDTMAWKADGMDLQFVRVTAVDSKGNRVPNAEAELKFEVSGPATIAAVSSGDNTSDELNVTDTRKLYQGRALVILRSDRTPGPVDLKVTAPGFKPLNVKLESK